MKSGGDSNVMPCGRLPRRGETVNISFGYHANSTATVIAPVGKHSGLYLLSVTGTGGKRGTARKGLIYMLAQHLTPVGHSNGVLTRRRGKEVGSGKGSLSNAAPGRLLRSQVREQCLEGHTTNTAESEPSALVLKIRTSSASSVSAQPASTQTTTAAENRQRKKPPSHRPYVHFKHPTASLKRKVRDWDIPWQVNRELGDNESLGSRETACSCEVQVPVRPRWTGYQEIAASRDSVAAASTSLAPRSRTNRLLLQGYVTSSISSISSIDNDDGSSTDSTTPPCTGSDSDYSPASAAEEPIKSRGHKRQRQSTQKGTSKRLQSARPGSRDAGRTGSAPLTYPQTHSRAGKGSSTAAALPVEEEQGEGSTASGCLLDMYVAAAADTAEGAPASAALLDCLSDLASQLIAGDDASSELGLGVGTFDFERV